LRKGLADLEGEKQKGEQAGAEGGGRGRGEIRCRVNYFTKKERFGYKWREGHIVSELQGGKISHGGGG